MPNYEYQVRDAGGQVSSGVIEAASITDASERIRHTGQMLMNIVPMGGAAGLLRRLRAVSVEFGPSLKDVMNFTNQLAVMIKAGINIRGALSGVADQITNPKFRRVVERIKSDVESGQTFSDSLTRHPKIFSPLYVNMVRASELSGNFGHMLERITNHLALQVETRSMVIGAMIYPAIIATMAIGTTIFMLTWVLPKFTALFAGKESLLPAPTLALMAISDFLRTRWYVVIGAITAMIGAFIYLVHTSSGKMVWDKAKLRIPLFRRMLRSLYISRGMNTMGELVNAGVPMLETLRITADVSGNVLYQRMWMNVYRAVEQGDKIAHPLARQSLLPSNVVQMISAGEESGNLGEVMENISQFYSKELRATIKAVTAMIEPLMIVLMGAVVGFIAMSIILPIFKMSSLVK